MDTEIWFLFFIPLNNFVHDHKCWMVSLANFIKIYVFFQPGNRVANSKTLDKVVTDEKKQIEDRLNQEQMQSLHLKQEVANVENRNAELTEASCTTLIKLSRTAENVNNISLQRYH